MNSYLVLHDIVNLLSKSPDRYKAHRQVKPIVKKLCADRQFLYEALRECVLRPGFLANATDLVFPLIQSGDVMVHINLFVPIRDGASCISHDNIHHHGWRLLTTAVLSGDGYEAIDFVHRSHEDRVGNKVQLKVEETYHHKPGDIRFIDSHTPHVVFHPKSLCSTLAIWSADKVLINQNIKKKLANLPVIKRKIVKAIHFLRLDGVLGLNQLKGLYYHPEDGYIFEIKGYVKAYDGLNGEVLRCMFKFFQQVEFTDRKFWIEYRKTAPQQSIYLIDKLLAGEPIPDIGTWGNMYRRFSKTQILQALDHSV